MERGRKRKTGGDRDTSDMISDLPRNIIECILGCLPVQDAVRTSILSRKWRYNWITLPQLVFDKGVFKDEDDTEDKGIEDYDFVHSVNKVLFLHSGPILKFIIYIPNLDSYYDLHINHWILFLFRNRVKELTLDNSISTVSRQLHSCIFSCEHNESVNANAVSKMTSEMLRFHRASPKAAIIYLEP
ncbi:hypothetical protein L1049_006346 [Liquidambar formosana]|uniref:F-box domain-containing protein n=1 Tax=Liquidambar formosana TaxID=63359 RepID=A0AAP0RFC6_LIQFO